MQRRHRSPSTLHPSLQQTPPNAVRAPQHPQKYIPCNRPVRPHQWSQMTSVAVLRPHPQRQPPPSPSPQRPRPQKLAQSHLRGSRRQVPLPSLLRTRPMKTTHPAAVLRPRSQRRFPVPLSLPRSLVRGDIPHCRLRGLFRGGKSSLAAPRPTVTPAAVPRSRPWWRPPACPPPWQPYPRRHPHGRPRGLICGGEDPQGRSVASSAPANRALPPRPSSVATPPKDVRADLAVEAMIPAAISLPRPQPQRRDSPPADVCGALFANATSPPAVPWPRPQLRPQLPLPVMASLG